LERCDGRKAVIEALDEAGRPREGIGIATKIGCICLKVHDNRRPSDSFNLLY
jgi:hypothetical protein